ncbi:hypothetical protein GGTG_11443 [Gaeumannomyces tritici R3-111a-1]|uniref:Uncharacterized protein n=1 Tax=Gaeumannomyces tritici (strain R3-111a-1) TaxID=644352 RepID=J3PD74_GAET3|nr:hypothetical protein GGTG_11443 [Gaeumannomyces tritici R3-111a-1]EJT70419.1 hypothetical protein GGTG_11443 [Gaeumannomyces tritici R3-111a-1]
MASGAATGPDEQPAARPKPKATGCKHSAGPSSSCGHEPGVDDQDFKFWDGPKAGPKVTPELAAERLARKAERLARKARSGRASAAAASAAAADAAAAAAAAATAAAAAPETGSSGSGGEPDTRPVMRYCWGQVVGPEPRTWQELLEEDYGDMRAFMKDLDLPRTPDGVAEAEEKLRRYARREARELERLADRQRRGLPYIEGGYPRYANRPRELTAEEQEYIEKWREDKQADKEYRSSVAYMKMMQRRFKEKCARRQAEMKANGEVSMAARPPPRPKTATTDAEKAALRKSIQDRHKVAAMMEAMERGEAGPASAEDEEALRNYNYVRNGYRHVTAAETTKTTKTTETAGACESDLSSSSSDESDWSCLEAYEAARTSGDEQKS